MACIRYSQKFGNKEHFDKGQIGVNPIPTGHGRNEPIYERHVTKSGRNRVKYTCIQQSEIFKRPTVFALLFTIFLADKTENFMNKVPLPNPNN